jgi:hypothetical protein
MIVDVKNTGFRAFHSGRFFFSRINLTEGARDRTVSLSGVEFPLPTRKIFH